MLSRFHGKCPGELYEITHVPNVYAYLAAINVPDRGRSKVFEFLKQVDVMVQSTFSSSTMNWIYL